jgi:hypothetical protein
VPCEFGVDVLRVNGDQIVTPEFDRLV